MHIKSTIILILLLPVTASIYAQSTLDYAGCVGKKIEELKEIPPESNLYSIKEELKVYFNQLQSNPNLDVTKLGFREEVAKEIIPLQATFHFYLTGNNAGKYEIREIPCYLIWECLEINDEMKAKGLELRIAWLNGQDISESNSVKHLLRVAAALNQTINSSRFSSATKGQVVEITNLLISYSKAITTTIKNPGGNANSDQLNRLVAGQKDLVTSFVYQVEDKIPSLTKDSKEISESDALIKSSLIRLTESVKSL